MSRPPLLQSFTRLLWLAMRLQRGETVTSQYVRETYGVSRATARRDLERLEFALPVKVEWWNIGSNAQAKVLILKESPP